MFIKRLKTPRSILALGVFALLPSTAMSWGCSGSDIEHMRFATAEAKKQIKIERSESLSTVTYRIRAAKQIAGDDITGVWFRFGFGEHPEGSVPVQYSDAGKNEIEIQLGDFSKGIKGCVDIVYGEKCGGLPQIVLAYEEAHLNETQNTVYCGYSPRPTYGRH